MYQVWHSHIKQYIVIYRRLALCVWLKEKQIKSIWRAVFNVNKSKFRKKKKQPNKKRFLSKLNKETSFSFLLREHWKKSCNGKPKIWNKHLKRDTTKKNWNLLRCSVRFSYLQKKLHKKEVMQFSLLLSSQYL